MFCSGPVSILRALYDWTGSVVLIEEAELMRRVLAYSLQKGQLWESVEGLRATPTMLT